MGVGRKNPSAFSGDDIAARKFSLTCMTEMQYEVQVRYTQSSSTVEVRYTQTKRFIYSTT